eukprot:1145757-Pelagomonas_calceolata.AAC.15
MQSLEGQVMLREETRGETKAARMEDAHVSTDLCVFHPHKYPSTHLLASCNKEYIAHLSR